MGGICRAWRQATGREAPQTSASDDTMLPIVDLKMIARARLKDAVTLFYAQRYDGAIYLCGYVVEIALKARICKALRWEGYPATRTEFQHYQTFRTHDLDVLLRLSSAEQRIKTKWFTEWSAVAEWDPEARYKPVGSATRQDAEFMIDSARILARVL